ncbi:hypothetical protein H0H81_005156 [Sphagnurus paluster]|uniref:Uncharacterized protein n=1 Tax=Sphagnurus paluster TaxID=117069 RepID=A0A9P7GM92_9AGAR|nr:hypothetical protein H0H81_005156 [Sphagnurus paluster]
MEKGKKRKRDTECPRITYHTSFRFFDRLFKEESLADMKEVVRKKLGIDPDTPISFAQIRGSKTVDLEDDDDFDAFYALAHSSIAVDIEVTIGNVNDAAPGVPILPNKKRKTKHKKAPSDVPPQTQDDAMTEHEPGVQDASGMGSSEPEKFASTGIGAEGGQLKKKKRKAKTSAPVAGYMNDGPIPGGNTETLASAVTQTSTSSSGPPLVKNARKKRKYMQQSEDPPSMTVSHQEPVLSTDKKSKKKSRLKESSGLSTVHFAEHNATAVSSKFSDRPLTIAEESKEPISKPEGKKKKSKKRTPAVSVRDTKSNRRRLTADELKTASADVDAAFARILAANRATLAGKNKSPPTQPSTKISTDASKRVKKKKIPAVIALPDPEPADSKDNVNLPQVPSRPTDLSDSSSSSTKAPTPSSSSSSSLSYCPLCLLSPLHSRETCPFVLAGPKSLEKRLVEIKSDRSISNQTEVTGELKQLLATEKMDAQSQIAHLGSQRSSQHESISTAIHKSTGHNLAKTSPKEVESSDSSSEDTSEDDPVGPFILPFIPTSAISLANVNLDDLIRGPSIPPLRAADIPSPDSSDDEAQIGDEQALEEEKEAPRSARKSGGMDSSDDADSSFEEEDLTSAPAETPESETTLPATNQSSFKAVDQLAESPEVRSAETAFSAELAAAYNMAHRSQSTASSLKKPTSASASSPTQMTGTTLIVGDLKDVHPAATPAPINPPISQNCTHSSLTNSVTDECDDHEQAKPVGTVQRMRTRSGKSGSSDSTPITPKASQRPKGRAAKALQEVPDSTTRRTRAATRRQTLGTATPPVVPTRLAKARMIREAEPSQSLVSIQSVGTCSNSQDGVSLDTWATLKPSSPMADAETTMMVDELEPSSPSREMVPADGTSEDDPSKMPLFIPAESQGPFPYSQWKVSQTEENDPISNESEDENEVEASVRRNNLLPRLSQPVKYRRLTDITSDHGLFSTPSNLGSARLPPPGSQELRDMYGRSGKDEIESESDSDSDDSDVQEESHIPKSRLAGVKQKR